MLCQGKSIRHSSQLQLDLLRLLSATSVSLSKLKEKVRGKRNAGLPYRFLHTGFLFMLELQRLSRLFFNSEQLIKEVFAC